MCSPARALEAIAAALVLLGAAAVAGGTEAAFPPGANGLIAFSSSRDAPGYDVFVMGADGASPINLTSASAPFDGQPTFSPDGSTIAFVSERDGGDLDVFVMGADG